MAPHFLTVTAWSDLYHPYTPNLTSNSGASPGCSPKRHGSIGYPKLEANGERVSHLPDSLERGDSRRTYSEPMLPTLLHISKQDCQMGTRSRQVTHDSKDQARRPPTGSSSVQA